MTYLGLTLISSLLFGFLCYSLARKRNANYAFWAAMGIAFGPLAVPFVFFSKPISR